MTRRCKPGQRARIIVGFNTGAIVLVVRGYFGEKIDGAVWPKALFPWVVVSLGAPLRSINLDTRIENAPTRMIVECDLDLEPLEDDEDGIDDKATQDTPKSKVPEQLPGPCGWMPVDARTFVERHLQ